MLYHGSIDVAHTVGPHSTTQSTQSTQHHTVHTAPHSPHSTTQHHTVHTAPHNPHSTTQSTKHHTVHTAPHSATQYQTVQKHSRSTPPWRELGAARPVSLTKTSRRPLIRPLLHPASCRSVCILPGCGLERADLANTTLKASCRRTRCLTAPELTNLLKCSDKARRCTWAWRVARSKAARSAGGNSSKFP